MNEWKYSGAVYLKDGILLSNGFVRIVHGDRGDYVEIHPDQICDNILYVPADQRWRAKHRLAYYLEYKTNTPSAAKVYLQKREVDYADYKVDMYYVSPVFLRCFEIRGRRE